MGVPTVLGHTMAKDHIYCLYILFHRVTFHAEHMGREYSSDRLVDVLHVLAVVILQWHVGNSYSYTCISDFSTRALNSSVRNAKLLGNSVVMQLAQKKYRIEAATGTVP